MDASKFKYIVFYETFGALLEHTKNKIIATNIQDRYVHNPKFKSINNEDPKIDAVLFTDNTGIGIASYGDGPPWSEVTPDPQWEAYNAYFTFRVGE